MMGIMKDSGIDWIGAVPEDWKLRKIGFETKSRTEKNRYYPGGTYIGLENISSFTGEYIESDSEYDEIDYPIFKDSDILFSKLRPYLAKVLIAVGDGFCTGELEIIKFFSGFNKFLFYYFLSHGFLKIVDASTYGTKMPRASWEYIRRLELPYPELSEQQAIANHLDDKCSQIDSLASKIEKQIELLKDYKKSLITETVTKGLDKNGRMIDSGIDWIGEIPEGWKISKVKYVCSQI